MGCSKQTNGFYFDKVLWTAFGQKDKVNSSSLDLYVDHVCVDGFYHSLSFMPRSSHPYRSTVMHRSNLPLLRYATSMIVSVFIHFLGP